MLTISNVREGFKQSQYPLYFPFCTFNIVDNYYPKLITFSGNIFKIDFWYKFSPSEQEQREDCLELPRQSVRRGGVPVPGRHPGGGQAGADHHPHRPLPPQPGPATQRDHRPGGVQRGSPLHGVWQTQARHQLGQDPPQVSTSSG